MDLPAASGKNHIQIFSNYPNAQSPFCTDITESSLSDLKRGSYTWVKLWLSHFLALINLLTGSHHSQLLLQAAFVVTVKNVAQYYSSE